MPLLLRHRLSIPALLTATALGGCTGDDSDDDGATTLTDSGSESNPSTSADDDPTVDPSSDSSAEATVTATESGSSSGDAGSTSIADTGTDGESSSITDTGSTTGGDCFGDGSMPSCDFAEQADCEGVDICLWSEPGYCSTACTLIMDQQTCCEQFECAWFAGACDYGAI